MGDGPGLGGLERHNHLHGLHFYVGLARLNLSAIILHVTNDLARHVRAEFGGVIDRGEEDGHAVEDWREGGTDGRRAR